MTEYEKFQQDMFWRFQNGKVKQQDSLDKMIFRLTLGTFILSINLLIIFSTQIPSQINAVALLIGVWLLLGFSIFFQILSLHMSVEYHKREILKINQGLTWPDKSGIHILEYISFLNRVATSFTLGALLITILFASINL